MRSVRRSLAVRASVSSIAPLLLGLLPCGSALAQGDYIVQVAPTEIPVDSAGEVGIDLDSVAGGEVQGFHVNICHDGAALDPTAVLLGPALQALNGGAGPDFFQVYLDTPGPGVGVGGIFSLFSPFETLPPGIYAPLFRISYDAVADTPGATTTLCPCTAPVCPSCPILETVVVVAGNSLDPDLVCGDVTFVPFFRRGDANVDGPIDIADPITVLSYLFGIGPASPCPETMDANDDDSLDIADAITLLLYINGEGPPPPAPFPACGTDTSPGSLGCPDYGACP